MTARQKKPLIAIVDDDSMVRRSLDRLLRTHGFDAITFGSGYEFLKAIEAAPDAGIRCVVLDVQMPGLDGLQVQRRLGMVRPELPVIFLSGKFNSRICETVLNAGALAYFTKPLYDELDGFVRVLEAAVGLTAVEDD